MVLAIAISGLMGLSTISSDSQSVLHTFPLGAGLGIEENELMANMLAGYNFLSPIHRLKISTMVDLILKDEENNSDGRYRTESGVCRDTETGRFAKKSYCNSGDLNLALNVDAGYIFYRVPDSPQYFSAGAGFRLGQPLAPFAVLEFDNFNGFFRMSYSARVGYDYFGLGIFLLFSDAPGG